MDHSNGNVRFTATLNDGSFFNIPADRMDIKENLIYVWAGEALVGLVEMSAIISAKLEERVR